MAGALSDQLGLLAEEFERTSSGRFKGPVIIM